MVSKFVYPYNSGSRSAKTLAEALGAKRIRLVGSRFKDSPSKCVINWGSSSCPYESLNNSYNVRLAGNKIESLTRFSNEGVPCPDWTTSKEIASIWLTEGHTVVCRATVVGCSGEGITLKEGASTELPDVPLYTKYCKKKDEYRVHVFDGHVIDVQRKMRKKDIPDEQIDWKVRNLAGGFIFGREGVDPGGEVLETSVSAVNSLGLLFGAVDIGYHPEEGERVYEVNTAPGLEGSTVLSYVEAIKKYIGE